MVKIRFDKAASTLWNSLPSIIRHEQSIETFKQQLETLLFGRAYSDFTYLFSILFNIVIALYVDHRYDNINWHPHNFKFLPF